MRRTSLADLVPGMIVARTVFDSNSRPLLVQNALLTQEYITRLHELGIGSVYVKDGLADIEVPQIISDKVFSAVSSDLHQSLNRLTNQRSIDVKSLKRSVALLIEDIISNRNLLIQLEDIHTYNDYLLFHSINVAVFSIMTGLTMGYPEGNLSDLGIGALLHDLGMIFLDPAILDKPGELTPIEREQVKQHTEFGFNILRTNREIPTTAAHIAYQHHEQLDGMGYPRHLSRKQILEYAKIAAIADTFDAIVSDRPYRKGYSMTEGVLVLKKLANTHFDPEIVEAFSSNVAIYPVGSLLHLNTGHIAVVTSITKLNSTRPVIHVVGDQRGRLLQQPFEIDLMKTNDVKIVRRLTDKETDTIRKLLSSSSQKVQQVV